MIVTKVGRYVRVSVSAEECSRAGIGFGSFTRGSKQAEAFLASLLADLRERKELSRGCGRISIEIEEDGTGLLLVICEAKPTLPAAAAVFTDPRELDSLITGLCAGQDCQCSLWKTDSGYALIAESEELPDISSQKILAAKIREYGKLLSDSPSKFI